MGIIDKEEEGDASGKKGCDSGATMVGLEKEVKEVLGNNT